MPKTKLRAQSTSGNYKTRLAAAQSLNRGDRVRHRVTGKLGVFQEINLGYALPEVWVQFDSDSKIVVPTSCNPLDLELVSSESKQQQDTLLVSESDSSDAKAISVAAVQVFEELTEAEAAELRRLELKVERAFYEAGVALREIRDKRLYRSTHRTFEEYCRDRFGFTRFSAYNKIAAASVFENLLTIGQQIMPANERQVRDLTNLESNEQCEVWQQAVKQAGNKIPTGRIVKDIVERLKSKPLHTARDFCSDGDVFTLIRLAGEERKYNGCWAIASHINDFTILVDVHDTTLIVKPENLKPIDEPDVRRQLPQTLKRIRRLRNVGLLDRGAYNVLEDLGRHTYLTDFEDDLLTLSSNVMESKTETDFLSAKSTNDAVIYRAVGGVAGTYQPSEDDKHQGIFVTEDGLSIPAQITGQLRGRLKHRRPKYATQPDFFSQSFRWMVYPKTEPLRFDLAAMKQLKAEPTNKLGLDEFCVVGKIKSIDSGRVNVRIQRNQPPRQGGKKASFKVTLAGSISDEAIGQIWDLRVRRDGETLIIIGGQPYEPSAEDLVWLEQQRQAAIHVSSLSAPILKQQHKAESQEDTTIAAPKSPAVAPALEESIETPDVVPQALPSADAHLTTGKMEVVVKLNQFPEDVRTVAQGWKEFEVDTGDCIVTISVKPKAFAALEQAQQAYPSWVAAISGLMGESTAAGFRLESPAIKVFEKKVKNTQTQEPKTLDNLESSPANQPPGAGQTQTQQQVAQPKPESLQERSPVANPMQQVKEALKQQRPSKTSPHKSQQQRDKLASGKKQLSPETTSSSVPQQEPVFQVKVNDRVFNGYDSVTLHRRIVCVDGKAIAQTKMAIVVGQPKTMQADGGVTQGNNQAVLLSK